MFVGASASISDPRAGGSGFRGWGQTGSPKRLGGSTHLASQGKITPATPGMTMVINLDKRTSGDTEGAGI